MCSSDLLIMKNVDFGMPVTLVDIDYDTAMATKYQIRGVPTLIVLEDGKEVKRMSGVKNLDQLKQWLED